MTAAKAIFRGLDFQGISRIFNLLTPLDRAEPATKGYVDDAIQGLNFKDNAMLAVGSNVNIASPGAQLDGVTLSASNNGARIVLLSQTTALECGIYIWNGASTPMTRAVDADTNTKLLNAVVLVDQGTSQGVTYRQTAVNFTLGTDPVVWTAYNPGAPPASTTLAGVSKFSTQAQVDAGTDNNSSVTPFVLANSANRKRKLTATIGNNSNNSFTITHGFNTRDVQVTVYRNSGNYDDIGVDVYRPDANTIQIVSDTAPASNAWNVVVSA